MHDKLLAFADIIRKGEVADEQIAKMAKVKAADVVTARAELAAAKPAAEKPSEDAAEDAAAREEADEAARSAERAAEDARWSARDAIRSALSARDFLLRVEMPADLDVLGFDPGDLAALKDGAALIRATRALFRNAGVNTAAPVDVPAGEAPSAVRIRKSFDTRGPDGRTAHFGFRGVYTGPMAAWLWENHRANVEAYSR